MDLRKSASFSFLHFSLSGFGLGLLASLLLLSLLFTVNNPSPSSSSSSFFTFFFSLSGSHPHNSTNTSPPTTKNPDLGNTHFLNLSTLVDTAKNLTILNQTHVMGDHAVGNIAAHLGNSSISPSKENATITTTSEGEAMRSFNGSESMQKRGNFSGKCDIFDGRWVRDETESFYPGGSCPYIDIDFDCHRNGRPDDGFLKWRWQPNECNIPRLNATDFLARLKGKRLIFVGDSLNRNMWESLVCILRHGAERKDKVYEASGRHDFKTKGYYSFKFEDYNCSVDFVRSPFLVRELFLKMANGSEDERLRLDLLDETTSAYQEANIVVFNTGHWWTHEKTSRGIDYYQEGDHVYPVLKVMEAYKKALTTWARWVDKNINSTKTQVFFRGYSLTHFRGGQWNSGGQCHKETEPIFNDTFLTKYPSKMRALELTLNQMKTPVTYLNISKLTDCRKDGHPSIYRKSYDTVEEKIDAEKSQDCSHWCLPGIPDTWNELLYASLLMSERFY